MECACVVRQETSILKMLSEPFVNGADDVITKCSSFEYGRVLGVLRKKP